MTLPTWEERKGRASLVPLSKLQLLGVVRTGGQRVKTGGWRRLIDEFYRNILYRVCVCVCLPTFLSHREVWVAAGFAWTDHLVEQSPLEVWWLRRRP